ncbi:MAG: glutamine-hydrolyzing carbamoyl-phosphate synthase small subunit [Kistimonas sp.]|nr:glutamine-hydrolyzing carbamoyl-phosphate synthase small subunit [Kistimonas sp.]
MSKNRIAVLALEDGSVFSGHAIGCDGETSGELIFNTAMTGYQEILTDPSYARQIVTLTYPHIGNTGVNTEDMESDRLWAAGLIIRELSPVASSWRSSSSLSEYLKSQNAIAMAGVDTRRLTRLLRDKGALRGAITAGPHASAERSLALARRCPTLTGMDLAQEVTCTRTYCWPLHSGHQPGSAFHESGHRHHVLVYDFGVKQNILRLLEKSGCHLTVVPAQTPASEALIHEPDGIFLSNGPGDPAACGYAIKAIQDILETRIPVMGICMGHQLLALASGAKTVKMRFGHHGANHPVQDLGSGRVMTSSQNHSFAVSDEDFPLCLRVTHRSLFDGSIQGLEHTNFPAFSFQGHPEASPGPHDLLCLFDRFIAAIETCKEAAETPIRELRL